MSEVINRDGLWWPANDDPRVHEHLSYEVGVVDDVMTYVNGSRVAVQAGGHVGLYPLALAKHFEHVITFEPCALNYSLLKRNLETNTGDGRVTAHHAGLSNAIGTMGLRLSPTNSGGHCMDGPGDIPVMTIDSLGLKACDMIWLDVEGVELPVLLGAAHTIERFHPFLFIEDKGMSEMYGIATGAVQEAMKPFGYKVLARTPHDVVLAWEWK